LCGFDDLSIGDGDCVHKMIDASEHAGHVDSPARLTVDEVLDSGRHFDESIFVFFLHRRYICGAEFADQIWIFSIPNFIKF